MSIPEQFESSEKLLHTLSITQISKDDYTDFHDFWIFSGISFWRVLLNESSPDPILQENVQICS
jgi:hypothetical protein